MKNYLSLFLLKVPKLQMAEENEKGSRDPSIPKWSKNVLNFAQLQAKLSWEIIVAIQYNFLTNSPRIYKSVEIYASGDLYCIMEMVSQS